MDRDVGRDRRAPGRQRLEDQRRVEAREAGAAYVVGDIDATHAESGRLAQEVDREVLLLVPFDRLRRQPRGREGTRHVVDGGLVVREGELGHVRAALRSGLLTWAANSQAERRAQST